MTSPQPSADQVISAAAMAWFESELRDTLRAHEERLSEEPEMDDISIAIHRRTERAQGEILAALSRIRDGSFGGCERCQLAIGFDRLEAVPHTRYCLNCATS